MAGLLEDPRDVSGLLDSAVHHRSTLLPFVKAYRPTGDTMVPEEVSVVEFGTPEIAIDLLESAMLPGAAAQGYRATPTDVSKMALDTMLGGGLLGRAPSGSLAANVWHGGPHRWAAEPGFPYGRPRLDKMGTGEGAQAYGPGFYSSEVPTVAKAYQSKVSAMRGGAEPTIDGIPIDWDDPVQTAAFELARHNGDRVAAADFHAKTFNYGEDNAAVKVLRSNQKLPNVNLPGTLYKLDIPDADAAKTLDWDAPLAKQPKPIRDAFSKAMLGDEVFKDPILKELFADGVPNQHLGLFENSSGAQAFNTLAEKLGSQQAAADALREAGIPGVKYLDQGSRGAGDGTRNYSIWDQDVLDRTKMLERDGVTLGANKSRAAAATGLLGRTPAELRSEFDKNVFHGTRDDFLEFEKGDLGFHFGTPEQASNRLQQTRNIFGVSGENIIPAKIKIKNPLSLTDLGEWNDPAVVAMGIIERGGAFGKKHQETLQQISDEASEIKSQFADIDDWKASYEAETLLDEIRMLMQKDGYDGVKYKNEAENKFGDRGGFTVEGQKAYNELNKEHHELRKAIALRRPPPPAAGASKVEVEQWLKSSEPKPTAAEAKRLDNIEKEKAKLEETETYSPFSYIVFDPSNIRSRFAAFDPKRADSASILAANKSPTAATAGLLSRLPMDERYDDAIKLGAARSGMSEDAFAALARQDYVAPQVAPIGARGQELGFETPYSKNLKVPVEQLQVLDQGLLTSAPATAGPRGLATSIENLEGKVLVPMPGDRTSRDVVSQVAGRTIEPYQVEGGYAYMPDLQGWASGEGVISRYKKIFDDLEGKGVAVGTPMAGTGSDYAHAGVDVLYRTYDVYGMPKKTKQAIIKDINAGAKTIDDLNIKNAKKAAEKTGKKYAAPQRVEKLKAFDGTERALFDESPIHRKLLMETLDKSNIAKLEGAPDAVTLRHAITDDRFRDLTRGNPDPLSGFDFMGFSNPRVMPTTETAMPHKSYSTHIGGEYLGGLETPVPRSVLFPDFATKMEAQGRPLSQHNYMFDRMKPTQLVTPEVIEGVQQFTRGLFSQ